MLFSLNNKKTYKISTFFMLCVMITSFSLAPISYKTGNIQNAEALRAVVVVGGTGTVQETISAKATTLVAGFQKALGFKEFTLDGIAVGLARMMVQSMTQSILTWINSGFQGSPAFVEDLEQFIIDKADRIVGDFIYNDPNLAFLCSPFRLDVKIALAMTYQQRAHAGLDAQCTLNDVTDNVEGFLHGDFRQGGWASWFEVTQNPVNTPTGAFLEAEAEMYARIVDEQGRTIKELDWGKGFLSFKVCSDTDAATGKQTNCTITTPGTVIANQINKSLGAGQDALIEADEINEIIGALFAQLAKRAITGAYGLLGLGQRPSSGSDQRSLLDRLSDEDMQANELLNPFISAIETEENQLALQNIIVAEINTIEERITSAKITHIQCFGVSLPTELTDKRIESIEKIIISESALIILNQLKIDFEEAPNPETKLTIVNQLRIMEQSGYTTTIIESMLADIYVQTEFAGKISSINSIINNNISSCEDDDDD